MRGRGRGAASAPDESTETPECQCGQPAAERTVVKESANKGRRFFVCAKGKTDGCDFFAWSDAAAPAAPASAARKRPLSAVTNVRDRYDGALADAAGSWAGRG